MGSGVDTPRRRRRPKAAWVFAGCVAILVVVALGMVGVAFVQFASGFNFDLPQRKHLKAIPIAASACPYVRAMHATANEFQSAEPVFGSAYLGPGNDLVMPTWPEVHARVKTTLMNLQLAILVGRPHFPLPVRRQLTATLDSIHTGLYQLAHVRNLNELSNYINGNRDTAMQKGQAAFGFAGDLIGTQCRVTLGADSQLGQPVTTTTPVPS